MSKKSSHWIRSLIAVFFIAIVLFLLIYFFVPELSLKFFGIAFGEEATVSTALKDMLVELGISEEDAESFINSTQGKDAIDAVIEGTKKGADALGDTFSSQELKDIATGLKEGAKEGVEAISKGSEV